MEPMSAVISLPDPPPRAARDPRVAEREQHKLAKRLKRRKLQLKDCIARLESLQIPDEPA